MAKLKYTTTESWTIITDNANGKEVLHTAKTTLVNVLMAADAKHARLCDPDSIKAGCSLAQQTNLKDWSLYHVTLTYKSQSRFMIGLHTIFAEALMKAFPRSIYGHIRFDVPVDQRTETPLMMIEWQDIHEALMRKFGISKITSAMQTWLEKEYGLYQLAYDLKEGMSYTLTIETLAADTFDDEKRLFGEFAQAFDLPYGG